KWAFVLIPGLMIGFSVLPLAFIPVGEYFPLPVSTSLLAAVALIALNPLLIVLVGWATSNKFAVIGSLREAFLIISYEVPFLISVLSMIIIYNSIDLLQIVNKQAMMWGAVLNPLAAIVFLITAARSTGRFPFEICEAESELIMGPYTEYSGLFFGIVMGVSYMELYAYALVFADLFMGGWLPVTALPMTGIALIDKGLLPGLVTVGKAFIIMVVMIFLRSVYPRYRVDQGIRIGWERMFPISLLALFLSMGLVIGGVAL
ncbi:NADH-quinone oxidoreductase subunit NuoH, partial [Candidatus Micrarchaeota archaeon]